MNFARYTAVKIAGPAVGVFLGFTVFAHRHDITGWFLHGIPWWNVAKICIALGILAGCVGILFMIVWFGKGGIVVAIVVGFIVYVAVSAATHKSPYRDYTAQVVVVQKGQTLAQLCARWRPTWTLQTCHDRLRDQNRAPDLDHLRAGDRLYFDKSEGHKHNSDEYRDLQDYKPITVTIGKTGQYMSLTAACKILRPTWQVKPCAKKIAHDNPVLAPGAKLWTVAIPADL
jgi:hypothetical protein